MPLKSYTPIVPKITSVKQKRRRMLSIVGIDLSIVRTSPRMPYSEFRVRSGLMIRITLIAEIFNAEADSENHPRITTVKSSMFHGSRK